jgi:hypothetical protein
MKSKFTLLGGYASWGMSKSLCCFPISCGFNLKFMVDLTSMQGLRYIELYLNNKPIWVYSYNNIDYTQILSYSQMTA